MFLEPPMAHKFRRAKQKEDRQNKTRVGNQIEVKRGQQSWLVPFT